MLALATLPIYFLIRRRAAFQPVPAQVLNSENGIGGGIPFLPAETPDARDEEGNGPEAQH
ncbi:MAG: hypothetical protein QM757_38635 [Paludibaculum sp.]